MNTFILKDKRKLTIDWASYDSVKSVSQDDMLEVREQLNDCITIIKQHSILHLCINCIHMTKKLPRLDCKGCEAHDKFMHQ